MRCSGMRNDFWMPRASITTGRVAAAGASGRPTGDVVRCCWASHAWSGRTGATPANYRVAAAWRVRGPVSARRSAHAGPDRHARGRGLRGGDAGGHDGAPAASRPAGAVPGPEPARRRRCPTCSRSGSSSRWRVVAGAAACRRDRRRAERRRAERAHGRAGGGAGGGADRGQGLRPARAAATASRSCSPPRRSGGSARARAGARRARPRRGRRCWRSSAALRRRGRWPRSRCWSRCCASRTSPRSACRASCCARSPPPPRSPPTGACGSGGCRGAGASRPIWRRSASLLLLVPDLVIFRPEEAAGDLAVALETGIIQFHHNFLLGPANEVLDGRAMLVGTASQYGVSSIYLLAAWFQVAPIGYGTLGLLTGALTALWFGAGYGVLRLAGTSRLAVRRGVRRRGRRAGVQPLLSGRLAAPVGAAALRDADAARARARSRASGSRAVRVPPRSRRPRSSGSRSVWSLEAFAYTTFVFAVVASVQAWLLAGAGTAARAGAPRRSARRSRASSPTRCSPGRRSPPPAGCRTGASTSPTCGSSSSAASATSPTTSRAGRRGSPSAPATWPRRRRWSSWRAGAARSSSASARR